MEGIPVGSSVKASDFRQLIHPVGAVVLIWIRAIAAGEEESFKEAFLGYELLEILTKFMFMVLFFMICQSFVLKPFDHL